jgi:cell division protein FtsB
MKNKDLNTVFHALAEESPAFALSGERNRTLLFWDTILGEAYSETTSVLGNFYRKRVDQALDEIEAYKGDIPRFWKLYSSGFIIKSPAKTIAVDINGGCTPPNGRTAVTLKNSQMKRIADLADEFYNTHSHEDHICGELCDAFARRKKLMVMPREAIYRWVIKGAVAAENFRSEDTRVFMNWQGDVNGGLPCAMYLFTLNNNKNVFVRGDIYHDEGFISCIDHVKEWGKKVDYAFLTPYYKGKIVPVETLYNEFKCRFIPIHEWEFSHRKLGCSGPATQCFGELYGAFDLPYRNNAAQFLAWGESILLD